MSILKLEDPTVDVGDIEKYRMAFLMQFFVLHKRRFRFPRLRLQDLYQKVLKDPDPVAFCDLAARILRFLNHDDPDICMATIDQALDRFAIDKRTSYRINMQRHRNGKLVHQLGPAARAALLDNLIESVYDEQPDFNFTTCFNSSVSNGGGARGGGPNNSSTSAGLDRIDTQDLFGSTDLVGSGGDGCNMLTETEDVNVLIKAGQDAQGCSYYYMDDLRLYRERPQSGISSQWDIAVGPTADQWLAFIMSLSRNEKEYDLYCFLKQDLFELVKESLDALELHAPNTELDSHYLRTKELNELTELKRRRQFGYNHKSTSFSLTENDKLQLNNSVVNLGGVNGPKSASPAFSGGHGGGGGGGIGSSGSSTSGAPLTPSSARTPTSAPPASSIHQQQLSLPPPPSSDCSETLQTSVKTESSSSLNQSGVRSQDAKVRTSSSQSPCDTVELLPTPKSEVNTPLECTNISSSAELTSSSHHDALVNATHSMSQSTLSSPSPVVTAPGKCGQLPSTLGSVNANETIRNSNVPTDQTIVQMSNNNPAICEPLASFIGTNTMSTMPVMNTTTSTTITNNSSTSNVICAGSQLMPSSPSIVSTTPGLLNNDSSTSWNSPGLPNSNSNIASSPSFPRDRKLPSTNDPIGISTQPPSSQVQRPNNAMIDERNYRPYPSFQQLSQNQVPGHNVISKQTYPFDSHMIKGSPTEIIDPSNNTKSMNSTQFRHMCAGHQEVVNPCAGMEHSILSGPNSKQCIGPATALVQPMVGIPDSNMPLTQEQWENRKSKIAQLEKIHSTLSKSKSASTPGAMAGAVLQQRLMRNSASMQQQQEQQSMVLSNSSGQPPPPTAINNSPQYSESFGARSVDVENYGIFRQGGLVNSYVNNESAQQEWDRLCSDYQRGKGDTSVMRYSSPRQMGFFDMSNCSVPPHESNLSSQCSVPSMASGTMMLPSGQLMMMDQQACQPPPPAYQNGPPVVMVPPNNSNLCSTNPGYPSSDSLTSLPIESCRTLGSMGTVCPESMTPGVVPVAASAGQKRSYHSATNNDIWLSSNSIPLSMSPIQNNENPALAVGHIQSGAVPSVCRTGQALNAVQSPVAVGSIPPTCVPNTNNNQSVGGIAGGGGRSSGSTKPGTKKRKAAGVASGRSHVVVTNPSYPQSLSLHQQPSPTNQNIHCLKQSTPNSVTTPNKSSTNPSYIGADDIPVNHFSRSTPGHPRSMNPGPPSSGRSQFQPTDPCMMHYSDMMYGPNSGQIPLEQQSSNMEMMMMINSRHTGTPKGSVEPYPGVTGGPISPNVSSSCTISTHGSRAGLNCSTNYGPINNYSGNSSSITSNKSMSHHPYFNSPDMMGSNSDSGSIRATPSTPCTQHLTSASLASLARLSQMSGPEGPYIPSCSSSLYNPIPGHTSVYSNRSGPMTSFHPDGSPIITPPTPQPGHHIMSQGVRNHNSISSPGNYASKTHMCNPNQSLSSNNMILNNCNMPHSLSSQTIPLHSKFNSHGYPHSNPQLQPALQQQQPQTPTGSVTNCGSSLPSPVPNLPTPSQQQHQQQPPSIQVNNTFFNAQLNVQQMNYQHVTAPGSTGQMQIHFAQQQQQPPPTTPQPQTTPSSHEHLRPTVRHPDNSTIRMTNASNEYPSLSLNNSNHHPLLYNTDAVVNHHQHQQHRVIDCPSKSEIPGIIPPSSVITSSVVCTPLVSSVGVTGGSGSYGNASIQITPRTPHTIQYLPTVAPQASNNQGPSGISPGSNQIQRSSSARCYQYVSSDIDNNNNASHSTDNSMRHPSFQSNQSYTTNQNITGQFYNSNHHQQQNYLTSSQSSTIQHQQQTYPSPSNLQSQSKNLHYLNHFSGGRSNNSSSNSTFGWNDVANFDSMSSGPASSLTLPSSNDTGLNGFMSSTGGNQSQTMDNRLGRNTNQQVLRDAQMNNNYSICNNSNNSSGGGGGSGDVLSYSSMSCAIDPSTDTTSNQMFSTNPPEMSVQQRFNINPNSQQYVRQPTNNSSKPHSYSSSTQQQQYQNQTNQLHQQYYHHQQQQQRYQHHQMMMSSSSSSSLCDFSGSSDWNSTNQVQFVMSNSSTSNSTMYNTSHISSNDIVDNINMENVGHTTNVSCNNNNNSNNSSMPPSNSNKRPPVLNPMNDEVKHISFNSQHHPLPNQQSQQMMMLNNNNNNNNRSNWPPHQSIGNQIAFTTISSSSSAAAASGVSTPSSVNVSREMYCGQMHNSNNNNNAKFPLNALPPISGNALDTSLGMTDNNNRSILRQSQDSYDNSLPVSSMPSSTSSSSQPYSSSVV